MERLPIELLDSVFEFLSGDPEVTDNTLRRTRLVCRSFCSALTPIAFRRVRLCDFNRDAFDCLVSLSQSPLASCVRTFEYKVVQHIPLPNIHEADYYLADDYDGPHDHDGVECRAERLVNRHQMYLAQVDVLGTFYDVASLVKAIPGFRSLREVAISRFDGDDDYPTSNSAYRALWSIVKALQCCDDYQIKSLTIDAWDEVAEAVVGDTAYSSSLVQIAAVARGLTSFTVTEVPYVTEYYVPLLRWLLFNSTGLERLCMDVQDSSSIGVQLYDAHGQLFFKSLVDLDLRTPRPTVATGGMLMSLSRFLKLHKETLRRLSLSGFQLGMQQQWSTFFGELKDELQLSYVRLESLRDDQGSPVDLESSMEWEKWMVKKG